MNRRTQLFVNEYLVTMNASEAARHAGYASRHAGLRGHALLRRPDVQVAIRDAMDARARCTSVTADRIVEELASIAFSDIRNILDFRSRSRPVAPGVGAHRRRSRRRRVKSPSLRAPIGREAIQAICAPGSLRRYAPRDDEVFVSSVPPWCDFGGGHARTPGLFCVASHDADAEVVCATRGFPNRAARTIYKSSPAFRAGPTGPVFSFIAGTP